MVADSRVQISEEEAFEVHILFKVRFVVCTKVGLSESVCSKLVEPLVDLVWFLRQLTVHVRSQGR